jgi:hypothetical protein
LCFSTKNIAIDKEIAYYTLDERHLTFHLKKNSIIPTPKAKWSVPK